MRMHYKKNKRQLNGQTVGVYETDTSLNYIEETDLDGRL